MSYSEDLRERVVTFVRAGGSKLKASKLFKVSRWCIYNWLQREGLAAEVRGRRKPYRLCAEALAAHVVAYPDAFLHERAASLGVSRYAVWYGLQRLGISRKKNASVKRAKRRLS